MASFAVQVADPVWSEIDEQLAALVRREEDGRLARGSAAAWHGAMLDAMIGLEELPQRHALVHDDEDPDGVGYRAVRVSDWRLIFVVRGEVVTIVMLAHVRRQRRPIPR